MRPPSAEELLQARMPHQPMPPVMSSEASGTPWLGNWAVFVYGIGPHFVSMPWIWPFSSRRCRP